MAPPLPLPSRLGFPSSLRCLLPIIDVTVLQPSMSKTNHLGKSDFLTLFFCPRKGQRKARDLVRYDYLYSITLQITSYVVAYFSNESLIA